MTRRTLPTLVALGGLAFPGAVPPAQAEGGTTVPLRSILRACDFSPIPDRASQDDGTATAIIHLGGGSVTADIRLAQPGAPGAHYDVSLIQLPRPANGPCDVPGPGVAVGALNSDGGGVASTTLHDSIRSGTTAVWVFIRQANPYSQSPAEFYTSDFPVSVR